MHAYAETYLADAKDHLGDMFDYAVRVKPRAVSLKELRANAGLTQTQLAERSEVPLLLIRAYEQGTVALPHAEAGTVARLARALMCDMERLVGWK